VYFVDGSCEDEDRHRGAYCVHHLSSGVYVNAKICRLSGVNKGGPEGPAKPVERVG